MTGRHWRVVAGALLGALVAAACRDTQVLEPCGTLPDRAACPASRGGTCDDRACSALYVCQDRRWELVTDCPGNVADAGGDAAPDAKADAPACDGAAATTDATCPALQSPDCDAAIADACPSTACSEGCTGFLRCTPQGWTAEYVAYCDDDGVLVK